MRKHITEIIEEEIFDVKKIYFNEDTGGLEGDVTELVNRIEAKCIVNFFLGGFCFYLLQVLLDFLSKIKC